MDTNDVEQSVTAQEILDDMRRAIASAVERRSESMIRLSTAVALAAIAEQLALVNEHLASLSAWANHTGPGY